MCGIAGIHDIQGYRRQPSLAQAIGAMCDAIVHRGPDDSGVHVETDIAIGMRRLSIIDVAGGKQPISNEDETVWIVFNGEIYNHLELRHQLKKQGHRFKTRTDTETILHLYEEEGVDCLRKLRGMFAFAIWDSRREELFLARDRLGIKPCFWTMTGSTFAFGSEIKSLLTLPWVDRQIDWNGFDAFFAYTYIPAPLTIYQQINKLPPAHYILVSRAGVREHRYWDLSFGNKFPADEREVGERFLALLDDAVSMRLMSEVPLGAFLSGGVDSGMIVALMSRNMQDQVRTFNITFGGNKGDFLDERPFAREIASRYDCRHLEIEVLPRIDQAITSAIRAFDEPFADDGLIPTFHICEAAKDHVTVILTGLGGDENFAGYERYLGFWLSRYLERVPVLLRDKIIRPLIMSLREQKGGHYKINHIKRFVAGSGRPAGSRYQSYIQTMPAEQRKELYSPEIAKKIDFNLVESLGRLHFERLQEGDILDRALYQDLNMYLADDILALSDRVGMLHSLELRVPFVDHKVVEFCARIPSRLKIRHLQKKYLLCRAGRQLLPPSVLNHRKQGFCAPMAAWLRNDLAGKIHAALASERIESQGLFRSTTVQRILADHHSRRSLNDKTIFALYVFQKWLALDSGNRTTL